MKGIVVRRRVKLQKHRVMTANYVWHRVTSTKSNQNLVGGRTAVVHRQVILHHVALIPDSVLGNKLGRVINSLA